ncbi:MAG: hypothetical protein ACI8VE_001040 [Natrialbaceae archaeon]|jgi:hypothetical protein
MKPPMAGPPNQVIAMNKREAGIRVTLIVAVALVISAIVAVLVDPAVPAAVRGGLGQGGGHTPGMGNGMAGAGPPDSATNDAFDTVVQVRMFLATFNAILLMALVWSYLTLYRDLPNRFTLSLILFSLALLLYSLASNPVVHVLFGYPTDANLGPFTFLPDAFAAVAVIVLLYQSYQ